MIKTYIGRNAEMTQTKVAEKIILPTPFAVGDVNVFLIEGEKLTMIDAGIKTKEAENALESQLNERGYTISDIDQVILTHHHSDHCGLVDLFEGKDLLGHEDNQRYLVRDDEFLDWQREYFTGISKKMGVPKEYMKYANNVESMYTYSGSKPLTGFLKEGDKIPGLEGWIALETFGHSQGHLSFYHEATGSLIGGDLLLGRISPNPILEPPKKKGEARFKPQLQLNESLKKIEKNKLDIVYPGHGSNITDAYSLIEKRLRKQHERAMHVKGLIGEGENTILELAVQLFPKAIRRDPALALFETLGQLDYLESIQKVEKQDKEGVLYYRVTTHE
jgi:glyoxylase-like metal-dependent hydrolase (beta-lactamase superfamily II)